jgi:hypothetical protein
MKRLLLFTALLFFILSANAQTKFRSGIFLHHSTGLCIWGPNGSATSIPQEMDAYNILHSFTGTDTITMNEEWWSPSDNEWSTQHDFFEDPSMVTGIGYYLPTNKIIVVKSCFPSSSMSGIGQASDTLSPTDKTIYNYKWYWRHIIKVMKSHPENFFAIWTNAPLEVNSTNTTEAGFANQFCTWAKDTLAAGLDPVFGAFPANVYVFDFFHKLVDPSGIMQTIYRTGSGDSHPNAAATALVAPQFVTEIFDASIYYESIYIGISNNENLQPSLFSAYPNPFTDQTRISFSVPAKQKIILSVYDVEGKLLRTLVNTEMQQGLYTIVFQSQSLKNGIYFCVIKRGAYAKSIKIVVSK